MEIPNPGVQAQRFLCAFPPPEPLLLSFLTPCGADDATAPTWGGGRVYHPDPVWPQHLTLPGKRCLTRRKAA